MHTEIFMSEAIRDQLIEHANRELPNECCGYITGIDSELKQVVEMVNVDASPVHFSFDPKEQFQVVKDARKRQQSIIVVYHSHPESPARLSHEDLRLLQDPNMVYLIISLEHQQADLKAYHIVDQVVEPVTITIQETCDV